MALKTNTKAVREKIKNYIMSQFDFDAFYDDNGFHLVDTFESVKEEVIAEFNHEKYYSDSYAGAHGIRNDSMFYDWMTGLPMYFSCDFILNNNANEVLGDILEQTEPEKAKYSEMDSQKLFSMLIYRELTR